MSDRYNPILKVTPTAQANAIVATRSAAWEARLLWFAERGLEPRLLDADDLAAEAAGLPYEAWPGSPPPAAPETPPAAPAATPAPIPAVDVLPPAPKTAGTARAAGYSGGACNECGGFRMKRSGTCEVCEDCGTTSGGCS